MVGTSVDRQCGSSQQALHFAAQGVMAGAYDVVIAAGVESMSRVPMGTSASVGGAPFGPRMSKRYADENLYGVGGLVPQGISAEIIAKNWKLSRRELDAFSLGSHQKAAAAARNGWFDNEIVPIDVKHADGSRETGRDRRGHPRRTRRSRSSARSKPAFRADGVITAGNSSQITDGAAAVLVMDKEKARASGPAAARALSQLRARRRRPGDHAHRRHPGDASGSSSARELGIRDFDAIEINEAFAPVVLAWAKEFDPDMEKVNQHGGAIALGHPLGCSGARLMTTLLNTLERTGGRYGLQTMCEGGGMANATVIERLE